MAVYWLVVVRPQHKVDIAGSYSNLISELGTQNLLPPVSDDVMVSSLIAMTLDPRKVRQPPEGSVGLGELGLGNVLTARSMDTKVFRLELKPQQWRELRPGPLQYALRRIARMPLKNQQESAGALNAQGATATFYFEGSYGGRAYEVKPIFEKDVCVELMLSQAQE